MRDRWPVELADQAEPGPRRRKPSRRRRVARRTVSLLPALFTLGNLLCGFGAIFLASRPPETQMLFDWSPLTVASVFVFVGMVFDGLDGRIARLTRNTSDLGEQLDSMADMVCFGVAPAFILVQLVDVGAPFLSQTQDHYYGRLGLIVAGIYVSCAGLRLARFNVELNQADDVDDQDDEPHDWFRGLPTPGAAGTLASLALLHQHFLVAEWGRQWIVLGASVLMLSVAAVVALAMVSTIRYVHVLNRYVRNQAPFEMIVKIVILALLLAIYPQGALAVGWTMKPTRESTPIASASSSTATDPEM